MPASERTTAEPLCTLAKEISQLPVRPFTAEPPPPWLSPLLHKLRRVQGLLSGAGMAAIPM